MRNLISRMDAKTRLRQLHDFGRRPVQCRGARAPIVLLMDDLHWIDPGSDAFLAQLVEAVENTRTLLLVNFRPEYQAAWTANALAYLNLPGIVYGEIAGQGFIHHPFQSRIARIQQHQEAKQAGQDIWRPNQKGLPLRFFICSRMAVRSSSRSFA